MLKSVIPGTDVSDVIVEHEINILGGGLHRLPDGRVITTNSGALFTHQKRLWVSTANPKRNLSQEGDSVIGIVSEVLSDGYAVDIAGPRLGMLDLLAFDGASRRNCPSLAKGSLVFCRILQAPQDVDPQLTCQLPPSQQDKKKDWTTGEALFGELKLGCVFSLLPSTCRRLLDEKNPLLLALGQHLAFELCVGMNGRIWVNAKEAFHIALIGNILQASQGRLYTKQEAATLVKQCIQEFGKGKEDVEMKNNST